MVKLLVIALTWYIGIAQALNYDEVYMLQDSDLYLSPDLSSKSHLRISRGAAVKVVCQVPDAKPSAGKKPNVWSKVQYGELRGFIPYVRMEHIESWLPGAPQCKCREPPSVLCVDDRKITHMEALESLKTHNISISCSEDTGCPSLENIRYETLNGFINFIAASPCKGVQLIGGTELQDPIQNFSHHYSHQNGFRVDFTSSPCIDAFIHNQFLDIGYRAYGSPDQLYVACSGNTVAWKQDYWEMSAYVNGGSKIVAENSNCTASSSGEYQAPIQQVTGTANIEEHRPIYLFLSIIMFLGWNI
ncbi:hypothetical protein K493DRAFT_303589 [Basidiobolus meristosporus CBS 931.73]|uniref:SH3b domain-containing protein n=1 Tax=Basidiobolus meristosporus CBS 931.73 TaxID=1314790 RepID=A0A1Y1Y282_9FUNG|nr:hypothetical protein K493DRAFT_303589 [Basidiobolus meristosporus CBS 931.73]|eukprot:ORX92079.1 hypothetical protein K493DRAFT_303589 [Basidiobolus meristosporus CBS 931.73]